MFSLNVQSPWTEQVCTYAFKLIVVAAAKGRLQLALSHFQPPVISYVTEVTHMSFAFSASFLLKITRLTPGRYDEREILDLVDKIVILFQTVSGGFFALIITRTRNAILPVDEDELDIDQFIDWSALLQTAPFHA
jgi:hypothetical protein